MDHRRIQRTLFRMQLDPGFGDRLRAGDAAALASTALEGADLALLLEADPRAIAADRDGTRRQQFLRNVSEEFRLSLAVDDAAADADAVAELPEALDVFPNDDHFHRAVRGDQSLVLALASYLEQVPLARGSAIVRQILALEIAIARVRRAPRELPQIGTGDVVLAPWVALVEVAAGTLDAADRVALALDRTEPVPVHAPVSSACETVLVAAPETSTGFGTSPVRLERLAEAVAGFLSAARVPLTGPDRRRFARAHEVPAEEIETLADGFVEDRVLVAG